MADIDGLHRWERFAPDVGDNRQRPETGRLWLEIKSSATRLELLAFERALKELHRLRAAKVKEYLATAHSETATAEAFTNDLEAIVLAGYAAALEPMARLVGKHTLSGAPVATLAEYVAAISALSDGYNVLELVAAVKEANSVGGSTELFSGRRSGGWVGTLAPSSAED